MRLVMKKSRLSEKLVGDFTSHGGVRLSRVHTAKADNSHNRHINRIRQPQNHKYASAKHGSSHNH